MKTSDVLNRAADLIEERGWTQGMSGWPDYDNDNATHALCLEGGILAATGQMFASVNYFTDFMTCPAYTAVSSFLGERMTTNQLCWWNDNANRTAAEVIEVLRATAVIEAAKEQASQREAVTA